MSKKVPPTTRALPERLHVEFLTSAPSLRHCPQDDLPEVAFAGRSNAGKSSVLNQVSGHKRLAKVSKTPGRTQLINFFALPDGGRLVDLPGYGYAKAGKSAQSSWQKAVNEYLSFRDNLTGLVLVMDIRHPNQAYDQELLSWSGESELPIRVLLNKADKLSYSAGQKVLLALQKAYRNHPCLTVQSFSALKGSGKPELIEQLLDWLAPSG